MPVRLKDKALTRNAGWSMQLTLYQDRARTAPLDLTGYTLQADLRAGHSTRDALLAAITCTVAADPASGVVTLSLDRAQCEAIDPAAREGWADLLLGADGSNPQRICYWRMPIADGETLWT